MTNPMERAAHLACWKGDVAPEPLGGGITNVNFTVEDAGERYVVRIGDDIPVHGVYRTNERAAARAAHAAGISPEIVHAEPGVLVMRWVEGRTLDPAGVRDPACLERILDTVRRCHREIPRHFRGATPMFWVFQVVRGYARTLREDGSRMAGRLDDLLARAAHLESEVGPVEIVFGHNDLLAANFIDDGDRIWLIDWEYAGFNSPLFDLGGLASNNELDAGQERWMIERYFGSPPGEPLLAGYAAMKCASLLREAMWSMVQEPRSAIDFDYVAYTGENLDRFERAWEAVAPQGIAPLIASTATPLGNALPGPPTNAGRRNGGAGGGGGDDAHSRVLRNPRCTVIPALRSNPARSVSGGAGRGRPRSGRRRRIGRRGRGRGVGRCSRPQVRCRCQSVPW